MSVGGELAGGINALAEHPMLRASTVSGLARGGNHMLAALDDGRVLAWGCNDDGQLGIGSDYWARREQVGGIGKVWQWLPVEVVLPVPIPLEFAPAPPKAPATIGLVRLDGTLDPQRAREISDYIEPSLTAFAEAEWAVSEAGMRHPELAFTEIPGGVTLLAARDAAREAHHRALEPYRAVWPMIHAHLTGCPLP
jgi:hypothetical protein